MRIMFRRPLSVGVGVSSQAGLARDPLLIRRGIRSPEGLLPLPPLPSCLLLQPVISLFNFPGLYIIVPEGLLGRALGERFRLTWLSGGGNGGWVSSPGQHSQAAPKG